MNWVRKDTGGSMMKQSLLARAALAGSIILSLSLTAGCGKILKRSADRRGDEVVQESYPIPVYVYQTSIAVHSTPAGLIDYFMKDLSWIDRLEGVIQIRLEEESRDVDMSEAGRSIDFTIRLMGINFPCRMTNMLYRPGEELWLMIVTRGTWVLWKLELESASDNRTILKTQLRGQVSNSLDSVLSTLDLVETGAVAFDRLLAFIQAQFDPDLDPGKVTSRGLRGDFQKAFFQGYETSIWLDMSPAEAEQKIFSDPETLAMISPRLEREGECLQRMAAAWADPDETVYCPGSYSLDGVKLPAGSIGGSEWGGRTFSYHTWVMVGGILVSEQLVIKPSRGGSRVQKVVAAELPEAGSPRAVELMFAISRVPESSGRSLLAVKDLLKNAAN